ncbi:hypothetical protein TorRG33x02_287820 [Trema orientale]|uniref:Uncharacterized protein n=1 Tax=Trema orientale TaxID=63057 RepID=A0A2P5CEW2_TREOI|nr:hypothetical protein TorRG33x02_287820 [Trema orientale]
MVAATIACFGNAFNGVKPRGPKPTPHSSLPSSSAKSTSRPSFSLRYLHHPSRPPEPELRPFSSTPIFPYLGTFHGEEGSDPTNGCTQLGYWYRNPDALGALAVLEGNDSDSPAQVIQITLVGTMLF